MFAISFSEIGWIVVAVIAIAVAGYIFVGKGLKWAQKTKKD